MASDRKPDIWWLEGLWTLFDAKFPYEKEDQRSIGFDVGRQIVGLYLIEMLLQYAADKYGSQAGRNHNLHEMFRNLPRARRRAVEKLYTDLLSNSVEQTWDVAKSVDSLLRYWGDSPITATRYFWEREHTYANLDFSIVIAPHDVQQVIAALFIALHDYPTKPLKKRYKTVFNSLEESLRKDKAASEAEAEEPGVAK